MSKEARVTVAVSESPRSSRTVYFSRLRVTRYLYFRWRDSLQRPSQKIDSQLNPGVRNEQRTLGGTRSLVAGDRVLRTRSVGQYQGGAHEAKAGHKRLWPSRLFSPNGEVLRRPLRRDWIELASSRVERPAVGHSRCMNTFNPDSAGRVPPSQRVIVCKCSGVFVTESNQHRIDFVEIEPGNLRARFIAVPVGGDESERKSA